MIKTYDVALSFAGENRDFVRKVADSIKDAGYTIFYDEYEEAILWGKDLTEELPKRYEGAQYCIVFFSDSYKKKMWTYFERQVIISHFLKKSGKKYLLPVFLDGFDSNIPGVTDIIGYVAIDSAKDFQKLEKMVLEVLKDKLA